MVFFFFLEFFSKIQKQRKPSSSQLFRQARDDAQLGAHGLLSLFEKVDVLLGSGVFSLIGEWCLSSLLVLIQWFLSSF